jgi:hypothetical protein
VYYSIFKNIATKEKRNLANNRGQKKLLVFADGISQL